MPKSKTLVFSKSAILIFNDLDAGFEKNDPRVFSNKEIEQRTIEIGNQKPIIGGRDIPRAILMPVRVDDVIMTPLLDPATGGVWGHTDKQEGVLIGERGSHIKIEVCLLPSNIDINSSPAPRFGIRGKLRLILDDIYYTYNFIRILPENQYAGYPVLAGKKFKEIAIFTLQDPGS